MNDKSEIRFQKILAVGIWRPPPKREIGVVFVNYIYNGIVQYDWVRNRWQIYGGGKVWPQSSLEFILSNKSPLLLEQRESIFFNLELFQE